MIGRRLAYAGAALVLAVTACAGKNDPTRPPVQAGIEYAPGLHLDLYRPVRGIAPLPAIVLVHGGGFNRGSRTDLAGLAESLAYHGYVTVSIDYRLSDGTWFPAQALTDPGLAAAAARARQDAATAVEWLRSRAALYRVNPDRIAVAGFSAGAITAIEVATHAPPAVLAAVSIAGAAVDTAALAAPHPPLFLVNGDLDDVIPASLADATCLAAIAAGSCQVLHLDQVGHDVLSSPRAQDVVGEIADFLSSVPPVPSSG
jgi:dienelactone hydrolase